MKKKRLKYDEYGELIEKNTARSVFNFTIAAISVLIFAVVLWRIWQTRDSRLVDSVIRTKPVARAAAQDSLHIALPGSPLPFFTGSDGLKVRVSEPTTTMDAEGRIQIRSIHVLSFADSLQLSVKLNNKYLSASDLDFYLKIYRADLKYDLIPCGARLTDERGGYTFMRLDFSGLALSEKDVVRLVVAPSGSSPDSPSPVLNIKIVSPEIYSHLEPLLDFALTEP
ncbi:MAG: hypothetical protein IJV00_04770 [Clostridia bacterium]|nr:hypothetical protein [Clostridia bacterium]